MVPKIVKMDCTPLQFKKNALYPPPEFKKMVHTPLQFKEFVHTP